MLSISIDMPTSRGAAVAGGKLERCAQSSGRRSSRSAVTGSGTTDAGADHATQSDASAPFPSVDASPPLDASTPDVSCSVGDYYVSVTDDGGTRVFEGGCDDAGVPSASLVTCGDKAICVAVSGCGGSSIRLTGIPTSGTWSALIDYASSADADASILSGTVSSGAFPAGAGSAYGGSFSAPSGMAGTFCVERR
jgi:hypothetical protein